jgi:hypothetical protein
MNQVRSCVKGTLQVKKTFELTLREPDITKNDYLNIIKI